MGKPAARLGDLTNHGGAIISGSSNVFFNGTPAANALSAHSCPMVTPGTPPIPHIGMLAVPMGATTVFINKVPAIVMGDMFLCVGPPATVMLGSVNIFIGNNGRSNGGGSCSKSEQDEMTTALQNGKIPPVKGTENYPIDLQATALVMQKYHTPEQFEQDLKLLDSLAEQRALADIEEKKRVKLTLKDFADIFKAIEKEQGYEAARHYASVGINYNRLTEIAKSFTDGRDTNPDNDPNIMPTRFMLLYGADDLKLKCIDNHPDNFENAPVHKINIANLRKGLRLLGAEIEISGLYDDELWQAHTHYINRFANCRSQSGNIHVVEEGESLGSIARTYGLPSWKYLYEINKDTIGENPDLLKKGTHLQIPQWDSTSGDEMIAEKGAEPEFYAHGSRYRYPWVPLSVTITDQNGEIVKKESNEKKLAYELHDRESGNSLLSGELTNGDELEVLIPDSRGLHITVDGWTCDIVMKG